MNFSVLAVTLGMTAEERHLGAAKVSAEKQAWTRAFLVPDARRTSEVIFCDQEDVVPCKKHQGTRLFCGACYILVRKI